MKKENLINNISSRIILQRLFITLTTILIIRIGSFLPIPGINHTELAIYIQNNPFTKNIVNISNINCNRVFGVIS